MGDLETFTEEQAASCKAEEAGIDSSADVYVTYAEEVRKGKILGALTALSGMAILIGSTGIVENPVAKGALVLLGATASLISASFLFGQAYQIRFAREDVQAYEGDNPYDYYS